jgi:hypothetical protein
MTPSSPQLSSGFCEEAERGHLSEREATRSRLPATVRKHPMHEVQPHTTRRFTLAFGARSDAPAIHATMRPAVEIATESQCHAPRSIQKARKPAIVEPSVPVSAAVAAHPVFVARSTMTPAASGTARFASSHAGVVFLTAATGQLTSRYAVMLLVPGTYAAKSAFQLVGSRALTGVRWMRSAFPEPVTAG